MRSRFQPVFFTILLLSALAGCTKTEIKPQPAENVLPGGKGGQYNLVFFSRANGTKISSRMYLKYGADKMPADTSQYNEKMNTMIEPGFGPHTHFNLLTTGTYFVLAKAGTLQADTVITIKETSPKDQDIILHLK